MSSRAMNVSTAPSEARLAPSIRGPRHPGRLRPAIALFAKLAAQRPAGWIGLGFGAVIALTMVIVAVALGHNGPGAPIHLVPWIAACATAWGPGVLVALGASKGVFCRDHDEGMVALALPKLRSIRRYVLCRILGLALVLAVLVAGSGGFVGVGALLVAHDAGEVALTMRGIVASVAFALAFSLVIASVTLALAGAHRHRLGLLRVAAVIAGPKLLLDGPLSDSRGVLAKLLPIPSALASVRESLATSGPMNVGLLLGAAVVLAAYFVLSWIVAVRAYETAGRP